MNNDRIDWFVTVMWTALLLALCGLVTFGSWLAQRLWLAIGEWVTANIDGIVAVIVMAGVAAIFVLARKDNPS